VINNHCQTAKNISHTGLDESNSYQIKTSEQPASRLLDALKINKEIVTSKPNAGIYQPHMWITLTATRRKYIRLAVVNN